LGVFILRAVNYAARENENHLDGILLSGFPISDKKKTPGGTRRAIIHHTFTAV